MNNIVSKRAIRVKMSPLQKFFLKTKGMEGVIQLGIGDPEGETPQAIKESAGEAMRNNMTHYVPASGSLQMKKALCQWYEKRGIKAGLEEVAVSSGSRIILSAVLWALIDPGDKVMIPAPYYPSFLDLTEEYGGMPVIIDTRQNDFSLTAKMVESAIEENGVPKILIVNSPNNPSGAIYDFDELRKIAELSEKYGFTIISDECYQYFSNFPDFSMRKFSDKIVVVDSVSKRFFMTGWRIGWCVGPEDVVTAVKEYLGLHVSSPCSISEQAAICALAEKSDIDDYSRQRKILKEWLDRKNLSANLSGGFYAFIDFSKYMTDDSRGSERFAEYILEKSKVALAPGIAFGDYDDYLRLAYCVKSETLREALNRLEHCID